MGRLATGKIVSGVVEVGKLLKTLDRLGAGASGDAAEGSAGGAGGVVPGGEKVGGIFVTRGVTREPLGAAAAGAGDIVTVAGVRYGSELVNIENSTGWGGDDDYRTRCSAI